MLTAPWVLLSIFPTSACRGCKWFGGTRGATWALRAVAHTHMLCATHVDFMIAMHSSLYACSSLQDFPRDALNSLNCCRVRLGNWKGVFICGLQQTTAGQPGRWLMAVLMQSSMCQLLHMVLPYYTLGSKAGGLHLKEACVASAASREASLGHAPVLAACPVAHTWPRPWPTWKSGGMQEAAGAQQPSQGRLMLDDLTLPATPRADWPPLRLHAQKNFSSV